MKVTFYNKEGVPFSDELQTVNTYNGDVYWSATAEHVSCAKQEVDEQGTTRLYVKKCTTGPNGGHFINPYGALSNPKDLTAYDTMSARRHYEYTPVDRGVFNQYLTFLVSRNPSNLRNAERDYNNSPKEKYTHANR